MIEVFTTNIQTKTQAKYILKTLKKSFPKLKINFDINESQLSYPCEHSILRVEDSRINSENIMSIIKHSGFLCDILEDKICNHING